MGDCQGSAGAHSSTPAGSIAIVAHGGVGALLLCWLKNVPISRLEDRPGQGNFFVSSVPAGNSYTVGARSMIRMARTDRVGTWALCCLPYAGRLVLGDTDSKAEPPCDRFHTSDVLGSKIRSPW